MSIKVAVGIDIGSSSVKTVVAELDDGTKERKPRIAGFGYSESKGFRHGYVSNIEEASNSIKASVAMASKASGYKIVRAYVAISGMGLGGSSFSKSIELSKELEITDSDVKKVIEECEASLPESFTINKEIIHVIPQGFKVDGKNVLGKPHGMRGSKLEVKVLFITCLSHHFSDYVEVLNLSGIDILDIVASPLAGSLSCLTKHQQVAGCVLVNIGAETTSIAVFENGFPISMEIFQIGGNDVTNDIALGLKISLEEAERVKISKPEAVPYPRKKLEEIITARLSDIFDLIESHLKKLGRNGLLPAGIIFTGGASMGLYTEELAKQMLRLPTKKFGIKFDGESKQQIKDGVWSIAYGLGILGVSGNQDGNSPVNGLGLRAMRTVKSNIWSWIKKILP